LNRLVIVSIFFVLLVSGCNKSAPPAAAKSGLGLTMSPGFETEYEGEVTFASQWGENKTPDTKYFITLAQVVLEKTADGYRVAVLRNVRESLAPAPGPGGAAAPVGQDFHVQTLNLGRDGTRGFPRPAQTVMPARVSQLQTDWFIPALAGNLTTGTEWPWQERVEVSGLRIEDCRTRYRVTGQEQAGGQSATAIESTVDAKLPFMPFEAYQAAMPYHLSEFKQKHWVGGREPWLLKYERAARTEQPTAENRLIIRHGLRFELTRNNRLSASELRLRAEQIARLEAIQNRINQVYSTKDVRPLLDDAKLLAGALDQQMFELLKGAANALVTQFEQKLVMAEQSEKVQRQQSEQSKQAASKAPSSPASKGKGKP